MALKRICEGFRVQNKQPTGWVGVCRRAEEVPRHCMFLFTL
jgi:hypothetical protein